MIRRLNDLIDQLTRLLSILGSLAWNVNKFLEMAMRAEQSKPEQDPRKFKLPPLDMSKISGREI